MRRLRASATRAGSLIPRARSRSSLQVAVRIFVRRRLEELAGKPEHALRLVRRHQFVYERLEVGEHFDLRERLGFDWIHWHTS